MVYHSGYQTIFATSATKRGGYHPHRFSVWFKISFRVI